MYGINSGNDGKQLRYLVLGGHLLQRGSIGLVFSIAQNQGTR